MNISRMARRSIAKNFSTDDYFQHVASVIECQLQEWNEKYEVFLMKFQDYQFTVKNGNLYYDVFLPEEEVAKLQAQGTFALDRVIWSELKKQEMPIYEGFGDYLDSVFA